MLNLREQSAKYCTNSRTKRTTELQSFPSIIQISQNYNKDDNKATFRPDEKMMINLNFNVFLLRWWLSLWKKRTIIRRRKWRVVDYHGFFYQFYVLCYIRNTCKTDFYKKKSFFKWQKIRKTLVSLKKIALVLKDNNYLLSGVFVAVITLNFRAF